MPRGMFPSTPRGMAVSKVMSMNPTIPEGTKLDISLFPELSGKKVGDVATITIKISSIDGKVAMVEPYKEEIAPEVLPEQGQVAPAIPPEMA